jgi:hypothetical protein
MRQSKLSLPEIALVAGTRGMMGAGIGILLSDYMGKNYKRAIGSALLAIGALSTIPLALDIFRKSEETAKEKAAA